jgi:sulfur carrier protein ThiS
MLENISREVERLPTMMEIEDEIKIIQALMSGGEEEVLKEKETLFDILSRLETSHHQAIFSVNSKNIEHFIKFGQWLRILKDKVFPEVDKNYLESVADIMEATFFK